MRKVHSERSVAGFELIKSGWDNKYHLIIENPEDGDYDYEHKFVDEKEIQNMYPFAVEAMNEIKKSQECAEIVFSTLALQEYAGGDSCEVEPYIERQLGRKPNVRELLIIQTCMEDRGFKFNDE